MKVGIVGLGYVGLPLAVAFAKAGCEVVGVDVDASKIAELNAGRSYIEDVRSTTVAGIADQCEFSTDFSVLSACEAVIVAVPTPLTPNREPDLGPLVSAATQLASVLAKGQLVVLESTTYPGTTRERLVPLLEESGLRAGVDFFVAYSPERIDPGRTDYTIRNTPKVVGGDGEQATARAALLYRMICNDIVEVSTPEAAEMTKLLENVFRAVNIALVNELAVICDRMDIDVWEVVEAAASKPYGFMSFRPGPGLGGHCLPIDPFYLSWKAREYGVSAEFVELAGRTNQNMPRVCTQRVVEALNRAGTATANATVAILGVAYKPGVSDLRESPALSIIEQLRDLGATLAYHDPFVPELPAFGLRSEPLDALLTQADLAVIVTAHDEVDYSEVVDRARQVVDFRGVTRGIEAGNVVRL